MTRVHVKNILWVLCAFFTALLIYQVYVQAAENKIIACLLGVMFAGISAFVMGEHLKYEKAMNERSYFPPVYVPRKPRLRLVK